MIAVTKCGLQVEPQEFKPYHPGVPGNTGTWVLCRFIRRKWVSWQGDPYYVPSEELWIPAKDIRMVEEE